MVNGSSTINDQITDSVTDTITAVLGHAPSGSSALLDAVMAETLGMSMHNAVTAQHNMQMVSAASVTATCARIIQGGPVSMPSPPPSTDEPASPFHSPTPDLPAPSGPPTSGATAEDASGGSGASNPLDSIPDPCQNLSTGSDSRGPGAGDDPEAADDSTVKVAEIEVPKAGVIEVDVPEIELLDEVDDRSEPEGAVGRDQRVGSL